MCNGNPKTRSATVDADLKGNDLILAPEYSPFGSIEEDISVSLFRFIALNDSEERTGTNSLPMWNLLRTTGSRFHGVLCVLRRIACHFIRS